MKRACLFRYHTLLEVCTDRIMLLRHFNPTVPIFGMYGGENIDKPRGLNLDNDYALTFTDPHFKWEHGDLCIRQWYIDCGHKLDFDMLHIVEWDLVYLASLEDLFSPIVNGVAVSNRLPLTQLREEGWRWITNPERAAQFEELCDLIETRHGMRLTQESVLVGSFPTAAMSRVFLELYAAEPNVPPLTHDEIRMTTFATAYGLNIHDTGVTKGNPFWNCEKAYFSAKEIACSVNPKKVFHPVKDILGPDFL